MEKFINYTAVALFKLTRHYKIRIEFEKKNLSSLTMKLNVIALLEWTRKKRIIISKKYIMFYET